MTWHVHTGDAVDVLRTMAADSVHCCVTSPPYWGLRDYGVDRQIGLEPSLESYLNNLLAVFTEVHRVLRKDGTLWVNMGDAYVARRNGCVGATTILGGRRNQEKSREANALCGRGRKSSGGLKYKDLIGQPWRLAFALQDAGWWLRSDIIWSKPCPMPESVTDRPTRSHEYLFLLSKSAEYFYDADAIRTPLSAKTLTTFGSRRKHRGDRDQFIKSSNFAGSCDERRPKLKADGSIAGANKRTVWPIASKPFKGAHFATFPPKLIEPCILAGCPTEGLVLDPFSGAGTTGVVSLTHGRSYVGIELNPEYADMSRRRIGAADPIGRQQKVFA